MAARRDRSGEARRTRALQGGLDDLANVGGPARAHLPRRRSRSRNDDRFMLDREDRRAPMRELKRLRAARTRGISDGLSPSVPSLASRVGPTVLRRRAHAAVVPELGLLVTVQSQDSVTPQPLA